MRRSFRLRTIVAAVLCASPFTRGAAQQVRGTVLDSASRQPIPGAVLILLDSGGRALGRNITNERGEYVIMLDAAIRRMQVLRLGFRPRDVRIPGDAATTRGTTRIDVIMRAIPRLLEPIDVIDQPACPRRDDRTAAFALWEQARTALLATVVAREANPARVVRLHFVRRRASNNDEILGQVVRIDSASTSRPFAAARTASGFVENGFVDDSAGTKRFSGPDADVMLDDAFVHGYCFQVADRNAARPREIGLGFVPAKMKSGRVDIEGEVWIDSVSRTLTDIEFRYVGLDGRYDRYHLGGRVSFRSMDNGTVVIDRWFIRTVAFAPPPPNATPLQLLLNRAIEVRESGGEVAHARWSDGKEWQASLGTLRGHLTHGGTTAVQLIDTDYRATTDSSGFFEITNLIPGPYRVGAIDAQLVELGILLKTAAEFVAVRDSTVTVSVDVPTAGQYIAAKCSADAQAVGNAVLITRVLLPDGSPARGASVEIRAVNLEGNLARLADGETDDLGLLHFCRAPQNRTLQIRAQYAGTQPALTISEMTSGIVTVKLQLKAAKR